MYNVVLKAVCFFFEQPMKLPNPRVSGEYDNDRIRPCATQPDFVIKGMEAGCEVCVCEEFFLGGRSTLVPSSQTLLSNLKGMEAGCNVWGGGVHPYATPARLCYLQSSAAN